MRVYYVDVQGRGCGLRSARNIQEARADIRREGGIYVTVRRATQADVEWVRNMGGWVPEGRVDK